MRRLVITNANIYTPVGTAGKRGAEMGDILHIEKGGIIIEDGIIRWVGPDSEMPEPEGHVRDEVYMDALGRAVLPGFVDSHTHLVFGGYRPEEFGWRLKGDTYMSIMERGGGIQSTVNATRAASAEELREKAEWYLDEMSAMGVTTVEAKSGYGLDTETEERMLRVIKELAEDSERKVDVVSTFLGAHAVPKEYKGRTAEYVDLIIKEMLPRFRDMAEFCDIFTEKNVFELEDSRRLLEAAREAGYKLKMHADEIVSLGGAELTAGLDAVSADHLLHVSDEGIRRMAESGTVATLLPLTAFALKEEFAPARKFIDAGCTVALASDHQDERGGDADGAYAERRGRHRPRGPHRQHRGRQAGRCGDIALRHARRTPLLRGHELRGRDNKERNNTIRTCQNIRYMKWAAAS